MVQLNRRNTILTSLVVVGGFFASIGCSTSKKAEGINPFEVADEEDETEFLDEPVERDEAAYSSGSNGGEDSVFVLPDPPGQMSKSIDGRLDEWDEADARTFDGAESVADGSQFWTGRDDASFRVGVDADPGRVYFWVDVRDDEVIDAESADVMADGIILWIRDPKLDAIVDSLPEAVAEQLDIQPEMAILFTPDGQFWRHDKPDAGLHRAGIDAATKKTKNGYRLEVALTLDVLGQVASLPTEKIAFRVELMDGDERERRGEQTRMSMLPDEDGPRFARYDIGGWIPYQEAYGNPPRPGALGRWVLGDDTWRFDSFEVVSTRWNAMADVAAFEEALADSRVLRDICPEAKNEQELVEAYESRSGRHRAGLLLCGARAPGGRCPTDAQTSLYWVHLRPEGQTWRLASHNQVTDRPLPQCAGAPRPGNAHYGEFSLVPLEMLGTSTWGIGWTKWQNSGTEEFEQTGIWFVNPRSKRPMLGEAQSSLERAATYERTRATSEVYLTGVDDAKGLDICEVERIEDQECSGMNRGCHADEHDKSVRVNIKMWQPDEGRFERYLMTKHKRCNAGFDFSKRKGFMLLHQGDRLGILPSPAN
ncbi:MAG: sugar-binding protein, partial [Persicimonas sp.]